jgi:maltooligosyltrehalose trehalohydrolase
MHVGTEQHPFPWILPIGTQTDTAGTRFRVWAPKAKSVEVAVFPEGSDKATSWHQLWREDDGYYSGDVTGIGRDTRYKYRLDQGEDFPDPASRYQPEGVHGPSQIVDPFSYKWRDHDWHGIALEDLVLYELHVGTATPEGTFDALSKKLKHIRQLGATAIELMPVAEFPGEHNWGYDGVDLFAPARAYGGPEGLRRLVDKAHEQDLAVILDVVFNHLGPEGNYLAQYSDDYYQPESVYRTPWGRALNFDGRHAEPVRKFFVANACYWAQEYHIDGLRIDAIQAIHDETRLHILANIAESVRESLPSDRRFLFIAEDDSNDADVVRPQVAGGLGLDAVWADDFHHQVRVALTGYRGGYFVGYTGTGEHLAKTLEEGWFYNGSADRKSQWHSKTPEPVTWGFPARDIPPPAFVYCIDNHDQSGNRPRGERLSQLIDLDAYRAASALLLLSPYTPLLFMGQEWASSSPFQFFTDYQDESCIRGVTEGRPKDMVNAWPGISSEQVPDPQAHRTFEDSKLRWAKRTRPPHAGILRLYRKLLGLRQDEPALRQRTRGTFEVAAIGKHAVALRREGPADQDTLLLIANLCDTLQIDLRSKSTTKPPTGFAWTLLLDSESREYGGHGDSCFSEGATIQTSGPRSLLLKADNVRSLSGSGIGVTVRKLVKAISRLLPVVVGHTLHRNALWGRMGFTNL